MVRQLLVQDVLLDGRFAHAAVFGGPRRGEPAPCPEFLRELAGEGVLLFVVEEVIVALESGRQFGGKEGAQLVAPRFGFGWKAEVHARKDS